MFHNPHNLSLMAFYVINGTLSNVHQIASNTIGMLSGTKYVHHLRSFWLAVCTEATIITVLFLLSSPKERHNGSPVFYAESCFILAHMLISCFFFFIFLFQGITFDEFRSFFQFLNNLEDFAIAMQMYNFASRSIGQGEWRVVADAIGRPKRPPTLSLDYDLPTVSVVSPTRRVCESGVCGHWAEADTSPRAHHLQDLRCGSR